ncbi:predicted protein [Nematostella vectensis]|uniref:DOMON domain-containing protein n=1 Tax=Nematostella vectensis TaxID=45351 RepID=A7S9I0_NEMVE|nr:DBH-like monooxygenase protein 1 homolog [Nematostella vectensis]EDO39614.1 predicted protein [Nematostella vectensis]|eukprot:XP_001631677.1 predicted protein [Nematostella vectensis]
MATNIVFPASFLFFTLTYALPEYKNYTSMDEERFQVWWTYENETDTFYFKIDVEAKGWIGFGWSQLICCGDWMFNGMDQYDVLVGGVYSNNGSVYGLDYLTVGRNRTQYPDRVDAINDWDITSGREEGNRTILEFNRKRNTSEPVNLHRVPRKGDIPVVPGLRYFVWAYHKTVDTPYLDDLAYRHDNKGLQEVMLLPLPKRKEPDVRARTTTNTGTSSQAETVAITGLLMTAVMMSRLT